MPDGELKALGDLAAEYADKAVTSTVQGVHTAISGRVFDAVGAGSTLARATHDAVSDSVYGALRLGGQGVGIAIRERRGSSVGRRNGRPSARRASGARRRRRSTA